MQGEAPMAESPTKPDPLRYTDSHAYRADHAAWHAARIAQATAELGAADCYGEWVVTDLLGIEPEQRILTCRRTGTGWNPRCPNRPETFGPEHHPGHLIRGELVYPRRYSVHLAILGSEPIRLKSREQLDAERKTRKAKEAAKREAKARRDLPLFDGLAGLLPTGEP